MCKPPATHPLTTINTPNPTHKPLTTYFFHQTPQPWIFAHIVHQIAVNLPQLTLVPFEKVFVFVKTRLLEESDKLFELIVKLLDFGYALGFGYVLGFALVSQHGRVIVENVDDFRA